MIEVNDPIKDIYRFDGSINNYKAKAIDTLDLKQFIPKGSILMNSGSIYAMVLYTGIETKLLLN